MDERPQRLLDQIDVAFAGVELGDGVSMHEAAVIDDYGTDEQRLAARTPDEKHDWHKLIDDLELPWLFGNASGLCFIDAEGLRFYLPACLSVGVRDSVRADSNAMLQLLVHHYSDPKTAQLRSLETLNDDQLSCVREVFAHFRQMWASEDSRVD